MWNSTVWIIIIGIAIGGYFLEQFLRRKLNMEKRGFFGYKHVNSLHVKLEIGLFIIYFVSSMIYVNSDENANIGYAFFIFLQHYGRYAHGWNGNLIENRKNTSFQQSVYLHL
ncbi:hypothetical protein BACERE00185_05879 [Bacillus mobilis]|uniref:DUF4181 domain-containing protein n=1 Tax=Bacillus mobilis TaxID=2026190 RepID=A0A1Y6B0D1_9BACI|nr:hypothetical protein BACERE00185_05879 [Bacillus mobilis]